MQFIPIEIKNCSIVVFSRLVPLAQPVVVWGAIGRSLPFSLWCKFEIIQVPTFGVAHWTIGPHL